MMVLSYRTGDFIPHNVAHIRTDEGEEYPIKAGCDMSVYFDCKKGAIVFDASRNTHKIDAVLMIDMGDVENAIAHIFSPLFNTGSAHVIGNIEEQPRDDV